MLKIYTIAFASLMIYAHGTPASCFSDIKQANHQAQACLDLLDAVDVEKLKAAADKSEPVAFNRLGQLYETGLLVEQDVKMAFRYYERSANLGYLMGQFNLARFYDEGIAVNNSAYDAVNWYKAAAEKDYLPAQLALARIYFYGRGVMVNHERALKWYRHGLETGQPESIFHLGYLYLKGSNIKHDFEKARDLLSQSATAGNREAQFHLAEMYLNASGVTQNKTLAIELLRQSASQSYEPAELKLQSVLFKEEQLKRAPYIPPQTVNRPAAELPAKQNLPASSGRWWIHLLVGAIIIGVVVFVLRRQQSKTDIMQSQALPVNKPDGLEDLQHISPIDVSQPDSPPESKQTSDDFYDNSLLDQAKQELETNTISKVEWDAAMQQAGGDMSRAELLYLKLRVNALMRGH